jgi:hypothetical protein
VNLAGLPDKDRPSPSARALNQWVRDAVKATGEPERRLGWMLASTVVVAALQRALGPDGNPLWLAKGGVYIQLRLGQGARATQDVDTLFRGTVDQFEQALTDVLAEPWGPFALQVLDLEIIEGARRIAKPRRFEVRLMVKGAVWRKVRVDVSFPEGAISERVELAPAPPVGFFGVAAPEHLVGIALDYHGAETARIVGSGCGGVRQRPGPRRGGPGVAAGPVLSGLPAGQPAGGVCGSVRRPGGGGGAARRPGAGLAAGCRRELEVA